MKKYIHNVSMLTSIEGYIHEGPSSQKLIKLHDSEKNQLNVIFNKLPLPVDWILS